MDLAASFKAKPCRRDLMVMYVSSVLCAVLPVKFAARAARLDVLNRRVLVGEVRIQRLADMMLQPFDDPLVVVGHGRGGRVVHVFEDGFEHEPAASTSRSMCCVALAVDVREEEELLDLPRT